MRVVITGGSGLIGRSLSRELANAGCEVIVLSRRASQIRESFEPHARTVHWDALTSNGWLKFAENAAIVNLAGENIGSGRWTPEKKYRIVRSRLNAANAVVEAVNKTSKKPTVIIQASGIGYYGHRGDEVLDENSSGGTGFLADIAEQWEQAIQPVCNSNLRCVIIRIAPVLASDGGFMARVLPPFRMFLGGHPGPGIQWFPWIHIEDLTAAIHFLIEDRNLTGVFNLTSPNPVLAKDFYDTLGKIMNRPAICPMPAFILKVLLGEMATELLLSGQKALPARLISAGYKFKYPDAESALQDIITKIG